MSKYCYLDSAVLINKFDVRSGVDLEEIERHYVSMRYDELRVFPMKGDLSSAYYMAIHRHLFQDMYTWNGQLRDVPIARNGVKFCPPEEVPVRLDKLLNRLSEENYLSNCIPDELIARLAYYFGELNNIHPFRDGNGRTQRSFVDVVAKLNGLELDFGKASKDEMVAASIQAKRQEYLLFQALFEKISSPLEESTVLTFRKQVLSIEKLEKMGEVRATKKLSFEEMMANNKRRLIEQNHQSSQETNKKKPTHDR